MRLRQIEYWEHIDQPAEWRLRPFLIGPVNLLVGRNAAGKTRTLTIINSLAEILRGAKKVGAGNWKVDFTNAEEGQDVHYELEISENKITRELLTVGGVSRLNRDSFGVGHLDAVKASTNLEFKVPESDLAVVAKRDLVQHPFLESLHEWASLVRFYPFGSPMGRDKLLILVQSGSRPEPSEASAVGALFMSADKEFPDRFKHLVLNYMGRVGYDIEDISVSPLPNVTIESPFTMASPHGLCVKERDLRGLTRQTEISQGMFRALAIIVHLAFSEIVSKPSCILIDDIGEGLDFDRSTRLINLITERANANSIQVLMATNDQFVMNAVPLQQWCVLKRRGTECGVFNYANSRQRFEEFRLSGLTNFDFFATESYETPLEVDAHA